MPIDAFFSEDAIENLSGEEWSFMGIEPAIPDKIDMEVWAQEFEIQCIQDLKESLRYNQLNIASFLHKEYGRMDIIIWE